jgi:hypothetical protein
LNKVLTIQPYVTLDKSVTWVCGEATPPAAATAVPMAATAALAATTTDIDARYLPAACRP